MSKYRPQYANGPPPPRSPGRSPPYSIHRDSYKPNLPRRPDFTFRNSDSAPQYPRQNGEFASRRAPAPQRNPPQGGGPPDRQNLNRPYRGRGGRSAWQPRVPTSDRPLLRRRHREDDGNLQMLGAAEGTAKYLDTGDIDDSDETDMDQSDSDRENGEILDVGMDGNVESSGQEPPTKRRGNGEQKDDAASVPKWSNPDPYTLLPPVNETSVKKKDPVETIRKYRKTAEEKVIVVNQVSANDDFISFNFEEDKSNTGLSEADADEDGGVKLYAESPKQTGPSSSARARDAHSFKGQTASKSRCHGDSPISQTLKANGSHRSSPAVFGPKQSVRNERQLVVLDIEEQYRSLVDRDEHQDASLGSRKRTIDDEIKRSAFRPPNQNKIYGLLENWYPTRVSNPVPWLRPSQYIDVMPGLRLHKEICDFYEFIRPQRFEEVVREELLEELRDYVMNEIPDSDVLCFGSFAAGLYLPNADMDLVVISSSYRNYGEKSICQSKSGIRRFADFIQRSGLAEPRSVDFVLSAKVPLVKFVHRVTGIRVDVSFENDTGPKGVEVYRGWTRSFPAMPILVAVIKQFIMMRGCNEVQHGGIGGFTVTCLVTSLLQNLPRVQAHELIPEEHLGEMLLEFLDFYGNQFDVFRTGILMNPPGFFDKQAFNRQRVRNGPYKPSQDDRLAIMDPNDRNRDISGGSHNVVAIFHLFSKAHEHIISAMKSAHRRSLLDWSLGGNYEELLSQRDSMRQIYNHRYSSNPGLQIPPMTFPDRIRGLDGAFAKHRENPVSQNLSTQSGSPLRSNHNVSAGSGKRVLTGHPHEASNRPKAAIMAQSKKAGPKASKRAHMASEQQSGDPSHAAGGVAKKKKKKKRKKAQLGSGSHVDAPSGVAKSPKKHQAARAPFGGNRGQPIVID